MDSSTVSPSIHSLYIRSLVVWGLLVGGVALICYMAVKGASKKCDG